VVIFDSIQGGTYAGLQYVAYWPSQNCNSCMPGQWFVASASGRISSLDLRAAAVVSADPNSSFPPSAAPLVAGKA
jgi:hypothetical protein